MGSRTQFYQLFHHMVHLIILTLTIPIFGPAIWHSGGIVLMDFVISSQPTISWSQSITSLITNVLSYALGYQIISKAFFLITLVLSGYLGVHMARLIIQELWLELRWKKWIESFGAIFFLINPFLYERMMTQPTIYLGVVFLGYGVVSLFLWDKQKEFKRIATTGIFFGLAWSMFPHAIYMIAAIYLAWILFFARKIQHWKYIIWSSFIVILLNINWLSAPLFWVANSVSSISSFGENNIEAFLSSSLSPLGPIMTNLSLYGFWGERYQQFVLPNIINPNWWWAALILLMTIGFWIFLAFKKTDLRRIAWFFLSILVISLVLGIGTASTLTAPIMHWMYEYIPYFLGFREPQKWIGLVMIAYAFFFLIFIASVLKKWGKHLFVKIGFIWGIFILVVTWTPGVMFWFAGQLRAIQYPQEFESLRTELITQSHTGTILALPWHSYIACPWTGGRIIANPIKDILAPAFVISADNIEVGNILYSNSWDQKSQMIEDFIRDSHDFSPLSPLNINKIILMKCADWNQYSWLETNKSCKKIEENKAYTLYSCE